MLFSLSSTRRHGVKVKKLRANLKMAKEGALQILKICEQLTNINLEAWRSQIIGKSQEADPEEGKGCIQLMNYLTSSA